MKKRTLRMIKVARIFKPFLKQRRNPEVVAPLDKLRSMLNSMSR